MFMPPGRPQEQPSLSNSVRRKTTTSTSSALGAKRTPSATFGGEGSLPGSTTRGTEDLLESATSQTTTMDASTVAPLTPFIVDAGQMVAARESSASTRRPRQVLRPLFHATASETTITAIECEPRSGAMAFGQSTGDVYVCPAPSADVDIASTTSAQPALVGTMPSAVKQLVWAPTRSVGPSQRSSSKLQLACCCPGRSPVVFTSAGSNGWEQETLDVPECIAVTFTDSTTPPTASSSGGGQVVLWLICICTRQRMVICQRSDEAPLARWNVLTSISLDGGVSTSTPDPPQNSEAIARGKRTNGQREFTCISAAGDGGSWVAVGDTEGTLRLFDMAMLHSSANNNKQSPTHAPLLLWTHAAMFKNSSHHQAQHGVVASDGSIRHIAWASSQGRSFTPVTYVVGTELAVVLIANAIATVLEPHVPTAAILGYRSCSVQDEVLKLAWNPSCTRITTSHADGTARVYDVTIAFRLHSGHQQPSIVTHGPHLATYDKYIVDVVEVARSVAPYTADPLANRR